MPQTARVKLTSTNLVKLDDVCREIMGISKKTGVKVKGPTPLPVKRLHVLTRKFPCGSRTRTYEKWEIANTRRNYRTYADDKAIRHGYETSKYLTTVYNECH